MDLLKVLNAYHLWKRRRLNPDAVEIQFVIGAVKDLNELECDVYISMTDAFKEGQCSMVYSN